MDLQFVRNILANAEDVSVNSPELSQSWVNGVTEYHLNPDRTNILRSLQLGSNLNILEVGCSSGLLSRYLGEQGHQVLGIKTGIDCLEAAKLRCSDLPNVRFATTPDEIEKALEVTYDAIVLMPPLPELVHEMLQGKIDKEDIVIGLEERAEYLRILMSTLSEDGVLLIATGNRLGLKYWLGASEDYYKRPHTGLWGYGSRDQKPRMFSRNEWVEIFQQAELPHHQFLYPFPDHQFAELILSEEFIRSDPHAHSLLYRTRSRDLAASDWLPDQDEFLHWKSLHQSGYLQEFANSFLIVVAKSQEKLTASFPYDFIKLSKSRQLSKYHAVTYKESNHPVVVKKLLDEQHAEEDGKTAAVSHAPRSHAYIQGPLLAELWIDALVMDGRSEKFKQLLHDYYQFLITHLAQAEQPGQFLDLLPFNIILTSNGQYQWFDQEWAVDCEEISADFILFRALLWFGFAHDTHISCAMKAENLTSIAEFISFGFQLLSMDEEGLLPGFIEQEGRVQHSIDPTQGGDQVRAVLRQPFQQAFKVIQTSQFDAQLFWVTETSPLSGDNCLNVRACLGRERQTLFFPLPDSLKQLKTLRFDPADRPGFFHIHRLTLRQTPADTAESRILWEAVGDEIAQQSIMEHMHYCSSSMRDVFFSVGDDPQIIIELPQSVTEQSGQGRLQFEAVIDWPQSSDYLAVLDEMQTLRRLMSDVKVQSKESQQRLEDMHENAALMRQRITVLEHKLDGIRRTFIGRVLRKIKFSPFQF
ncbi:2-polyprenyl-3-methyl-5-hydroxy-6-metoxy-1,4-benzoquinol methylase [Candidatus Electrothrix laxa]